MASRRFDHDNARMQGPGVRGYRGRGSRRGSHWQGHDSGSEIRGPIRRGGNDNESNRNMKTAKVRPTHFLALPLHNFPALRSRVAAFQSALFDDSGDHDTKDQKFSRWNIRHSTIVEGLDSSIVIDPLRMHMTLGVMALDDENVMGHQEITAGSSTQTRKTVSTALALLQSLSPRISEILDSAKGVNVPLDVLDVLKVDKWRAQGGNDKTVKSSNKIAAGVLFLGPREMDRDDMDEERRKLMEVCELINEAFKNAGYLSDLRPLKLHCTILNASHRKTSKWSPFSYSDILSSRACDLIRSRSSITFAETALPTPTVGSRTATSSQVQVDAGQVNIQSIAPAPVPINLGTWEVNEVQLWVMGSRDKEGRYVSCGGVKLSG